MQFVLDDFLVADWRFGREDWRANLMTSTCHVMVHQLEIVHYSHDRFRELQCGSDRGSFFSSRPVPMHRS